MNKSFITRNKKKLLLTALLFLGFNLITGGVDLSIIIATSMLLLGTPLLLSLKSKYESLFLFQLTVFVTMIVTMSYVFSVQRYSWHIADFIKFDYSYTSTLEILLYISAFQLAVAGFMRLGQAIVSPARYMQQPKIEVNTSLTKKKKTNLYGKFCYALIVFLIPIQLWMFQEAIGFSGIAPKELPFKLVGILYYGVKFIAPFSLAYLYFHANRTWALTLTIVIFGVLSSTFAASKGAGVIIIGSVVLANLYNKDKLKAFVSVIFLALSIIGANTMRNIVYLAEDGTASAVISNFSVTAFVDKLLESDFNAFSLIIYAIVQVIGRVESFVGAIHAMQYDPYAVLGHHPYDLAMTAFDRQWRDFDGDAHHLQYLGTVLPLGWYAGCNLIGDAVIIRNHELFGPFLLLALVSAAWLMLLEVLITRVAAKYRWSTLITYFLILFATIQYITNRGSQDLFMLTGIFFVLALLPRIRFTSVHKPVYAVDQAR